MAKNKLSDLRNHLFESIEMLRNNNDPNADQCEKMDLEVAKRISDISGKIIESYKVEVQAMDILAKAQNSSLIREVMASSGLVENTNQLKLE